eukprot:TRINITY_DN1944_c0_g1_i2.p1 TRINITY_DN1944_c0_g1~~TRINITY_DN1944_c0_g1_i2.p1  ORF type:complete len:325 (+),score=108.09 TRINITY_DN1944_c0_g1_i2:154-1128(+)
MVLQYEVYAAIQHANISLMVPRDGSYAFTRSILTMPWEEVKQLIASIPTRDFVVLGEQLRFFLIVCPQTLIQKPEETSVPLTSSKRSNYDEEDDDDIDFLRAHKEIEAQERENKLNLAELLKLQVRFSMSNQEQTEESLIESAPMHSPIAPLPQVKKLKAKPKEDSVQTTNNDNTDGNEESNDKGKEEERPTEEGKGEGEGEKAKGEAETAADTKKEEEEEETKEDDNEELTDSIIQLPSGVVIYHLSVPVVLKTQMVDKEVMLDVSVSPALYVTSEEHKLKQLLSPQYMDSRPPSRRLTKACMVREPFTVYFCLLYTSPSPRD